MGNWEKSNFYTNPKIFEILDLSLPFYIYIIVDVDVAKLMPPQSPSIDLIYSAKCRYVI